MAVQQRFPEWIRQQWGAGKDFTFTRDLVSGQKLHTVCQSAQCPNIGECWQRRTATMMVLGNVCTRNCRYCSVDSGAPEPVDWEEPHRVALAVHALGIRHVVLTSVTRDDLPDGGALHIARTVQAIRDLNTETTVEVLAPDFLGDRDALATVCETEPEVFSHNIETVERLHPTLRGRRINYRSALEVLNRTVDLAVHSVIKSALMVGHGETDEEVMHTLQDLLDTGCEAVSIGQYLRPTPKQRQVVEFVHPDRFRAYEDRAYALGFKYAVAGPFVRSSYKSEELMQQEFARKKTGEVRRIMV